LERGDHRVQASLDESRPVLGYPPRIDDQLAGAGYHVALGPSAHHRRRNYRAPQVLVQGLAQGPPPDGETFDDARALLYCVDPELRAARVAAPPGDGYPKVGQPLVGSDGPQVRRLSHHSDP